MSRLEGKSAVVTGGGRGIGRAICLAYAKEGSDVVVNYASKDQPAQEVVEMVKKMGRKAVAIKGNVALKADVDRIIQTAIDNFGKIDILVNNAGVSKPNMLYKMTEEQWNEVIDIQLKGPFLCIQAASKYMMEKKYGKIINVTSSAGLWGTKGQINYSSAKAEGNLYGQDFVGSIFGTRRSSPHLCLLGIGRGELYHRSADLCGWWTRNDLINENFKCQNPNFWHLILGFE
jgi:NAD(P)-dependent dehydrogenase (short-subunit alcohol dehydrogenase family)